MSLAQHYKWVNYPMQQTHYYKVTDNGTLHVNVELELVNKLQGALPSLAAPCEPEEYNQAIVSVWEKFNTIN